jgi:Alternative complex III, ActD subunit
MRATRALVGYFDDEAALLEAVRAARAAGLTIHDAYTPYAVHGLDEAMGLKPSRLPWVCLGAALAGLAAAWALQYYVAVVSWPLNVGGKPFFSWPAFLPVAFELTVLCAGLGTVAALLARAGLFPGARRVAPPKVTDDRFALALCRENERFDADGARQLLARAGALETRTEEVP